MTSDSSNTPEGPTAVSTTINTSAHAEAASLPEPGYELGDVIGRGGMGEVVSARDRRIGREVAIKRMRGDTPTGGAISRFLREARIQARLDHPAIVPVHELGIDGDGRPYFTMKRLAGVTLADRLAEPAPVKPMLRAMIDVCLAIEFAHERRCVHRDLKPANIMLGDYGEVYVLDWGIARVIVDGRTPTGEIDDIDTLEGDTRAGELLGTPGYMAPEQARGLDIGPATDVYALGAILFEILAGEPLHPRGTAAISSTLATPQQRPSARAPGREIAPELDDACFDALAELPGARPSARELADRIQSYLDGDRDVAHRRTLARAELQLAHDAIDSGDPERRRSAIHHAGRALALDPASREAAAVVTELIVEPPRVLPTALVERLEEEENRFSAVRTRTSTIALLATLGLLILMPLTKIRSWLTFGSSVGAFTVVVVALWLASRRGKPIPVLSLILGTVLALVFSRVMGAFVLTPVVIAASMIAISASQWLNARPLILIGWLLVVALGPFVLEWLGVFQSTWYLIDGGVCSTSAMFEGRAGSDAFALVVGNVFVLCAASYFGYNVNRRAIAARREQFIQAWHLQQLLPSRAATRPGPR